jgi:hypothetical protein
MITYEIKVGQLRQFGWGGTFLVVAIDGVRVDIMKSCGTMDGVFIDYLCKSSFVISEVCNGT